MKKLTLAVCAMMLSATAVHSANGDIAGKIYSTDILAEINGKAVPSYNIGGRTAIVLEDLAEYGYAYVSGYDDETRTLTVFMSSPEYNSPIGVERGTVGEIIGNVYESDITVYVNNAEIRGMNIGGKTAVAIEDLGACDENADFGYSQYLANYTYDNDKRLISLNFPPQSAAIYYKDEPCAEYKVYDNVLTAKFDRMDYFPRILYGLSKEFKADTFTLKPLYFDDGKEKTEVGIMYVSDIDGDQGGNYYITEPDILKEKLSALITAAPSYEETLKLMNDGKKYETLDTLELENYTVLAVKRLEEVDTEYDVTYVAVSKAGGYAGIYRGDSSFMTDTLEKTGENSIEIHEKPTGSTHGPVYLTVPFDLTALNIR